jgi:hypothetical protein
VRALAYAVCLHACIRVCACWVCGKERRRAFLGCYRWHGALLAPCACAAAFWLSPTAPPSCRERVTTTRSCAPQHWGRGEGAWRAAPRGRRSIQPGGCTCFFLTPTAAFPRNAQMEEEGVPSTALREVSLLQMLSESIFVVRCAPGPADRALSHNRALESTALGAHARAGAPRARSAPRPRACARHR